MPITDGIIIVTLNTNRHEASELLKGFILPFVFMAFVYFLIYFYLLFRVPKEMDAKQSQLVSVVALLVMVCVPFLDRGENSYFEKFRGRYYSVFPTSFIYSAYSVYNQHRDLAKNVAYRNAFRFNARQDEMHDKNQVHILVIGESARRKNWGLYGYERNTTPALAREKNLIAFTNTVSAGYITEFAVPLILTGLEPWQYAEHSRQKSIIGAFNEAGFHSYWLSNQTDFGDISIHSAEAQSNYFLSTYTNNKVKDVNDDGELLKTLEYIIKEAAAKKFIIIKLQGSHYDYSRRYPDAFDHFKPSNKTISTAANDYSNKDILVNSYDNSILYTDAILDSMIHLLEAQHIVTSLVYISDHGEDLFDDSRHLSQHASSEPSKYVAAIPFVIWYSQAMEEAEPVKIRNLATNRNKKANSSNVFYTYADMCGIRFPEYDSHKSLSSSDFAEGPRLILGANSVLYNVDSLK